MSLITSISFAISIRTSIKIDFCIRVAIAANFFISISIIVYISIAISIRTQRPETSQDSIGWSGKPGIFYPPLLKYTRDWHGETGLNVRSC